MDNNKTFAEGFIFNKSENAPDFVIGKLSIKIDEAKKFMDDNQKKGWINLDIKKSKAGKYYIELNTFQKDDEKVLPF